VDVEVAVDEAPAVGAGLEFTTRPSTTKTPRPLAQQASLRRPQQMDPLAQKVTTASVLRSEPSAVRPTRRRQHSTIKRSGERGSPGGLSRAAGGDPGRHAPTHSCRHSRACQVRSVHDSRQTMSVCCVSWQSPSGRQMSGNEATVSLVRQHMLVPPSRHAVYRGSTAEPSGR